MDRTPPVVPVVPEVRLFIFCFILCEHQVGSNIYALPCSNTMPFFVEFVSQQPMFGRVFVVEKEE